MYSPNRCASHTYELIISVYKRFVFGIEELSWRWLPPIYVAFGLCWNFQMSSLSTFIAYGDFITNE